MKIIQVEGWRKLHLVREEKKSRYKFYCGHSSRKSNGKELPKERRYDQNICAVCNTISRNRNLVPNRTDLIQVGSLLKCPLHVSESGWVKVVGDQRHCKINLLQPGVDDWDLLVCTYDHDHPEEYFPYFGVMMKEIEEWNSAE